MRTGACVLLPKANFNVRATVGQAVETSDVDVVANSVVECDGIGEHARGRAIEAVVVDIHLQTVSCPLEVKENWHCYIYIDE